jgi:hypothetical protein
VSGPLNFGERSDRAPRSGTRERTREIGYGEAVLDVTIDLRDISDRWRKWAGEQFSSGAHAALMMAADELDRYVRYQYGVYDLIIDYRGAFAADVERLNRHAGHFGPARRELPGEDAPAGA